MPKNIVEIDYTDKLGKRWVRKIEPIEGGFHFNYRDGSAPEWFLHAVDLDGGGELKTFAMQRIHGWVELPPVEQPKIIRPPVKRSG